MRWFVLGRFHIGNLYYRNSVSKYMSRDCPVCNLHLAPYFKLY